METTIALAVIGPVRGTSTCSRLRSLLRCHA